MNCYQFIQGYGKRCFVDRFWDTNTGYEIRRIRDTDTIRWQKNPKRTPLEVLLEQLAVRRKSSDVGLSGEACCAIVAWRSCC